MVLITILSVVFYVLKYIVTCGRGEKGFCQGLAQSVLSTLCVVWPRSSDLWLIGLARPPASPPPRAAALTPRSINRVASPQSLPALRRLLPLYRRVLEHTLDVELRTVSARYRTRYLQSKHPPSPLHNPSTPSSHPESKRPPGGALPTSRRIALARGDSMSAR